MALKDWAMPVVTKLELVHPAKGATGIELHLQGEDTKLFREKTLQIMRRRLSEKETDISPERVADDNAELAALNIVGWSDDEAFDGPYSPQRAEELMKMPELSWIREQVERFRQDRANFFRASR